MYTSLTNCVCDDIILFQKFKNIQHGNIIHIYIYVIKNVYNFIFGSFKNKYMIQLSMHVANI